MISVSAYNYVAIMLNIICAECFIYWESHLLSVSSAERLICWESEYAECFIYWVAQLLLSCWASFLLTSFFCWVSQFLGFSSTSKLLSLSPSEFSCFWTIQLLSTSIAQHPELLISWASFLLTSLCAELLNYWVSHLLTSLSTELLNWGLSNFNCHNWWASQALKTLPA